MTNRVSSRQAGFSILETVVVLGILLMIVMAAIPTLLQSVSALQLGADAQNIASELQLAKFKAASQATNYQVAFNTSNKSSQLQKFTGGSFQDEGSPTPLASTSQYITGPPSVPSGAPSSMSTAIRFNTHGAPIDNSGTPTGNNGVYLGNGSTIMYAITVPLSGRVQIWWYDGSQWVLQ